VSVVKRAYVGKSVNANGVKIKVKQVLGFGDREMRDRVKRVVQTAQGWLGATLPEVKSNMSPAVAAAYQSCFKAPPSSAAVNTVKAVLSTTAGSLRHPHGIKIREDDDAYGYVNLRYSGRKHLTNGTIFYDSDGDRIHSMGEIHIDKATLRSDMTMAVITYIHEATHRFANTDDHGDSGYFKSDGSDYGAPGLNWQQALNNADSYAYFVYKTVLSKFHHVIVT